MPASILSSTNNVIGPGLNTRRCLMVNKTGTAMVVGEAGQWALHGVGTYVDYDEGTATSAFAAVITPNADPTATSVALGNIAATFIAEDAIAADGDTGSFFMWGPKVACLVENSAAATDHEAGGVYGTVDGSIHLLDDITATNLRNVAIIEEQVVFATGAAEVINCYFDGWNGVGSGGV